MCLQWRKPLYVKTAVRLVLRDKLASYQLVGRVTAYQGDDA